MQFSSNKSQGNLSKTTSKISSKLSHIMRGRASSLSHSSTHGKRHFSASGQIDLSNDMKSLGIVTVYDKPPLSGGPTESVLRTFGATSNSSSSSWTTIVVPFLLNGAGVDTVDNSCYLFFLTIHRYLRSRLRRVYCGKIVGTNENFDGVEN